MYNKAMKVKKSYHKLRAVRLKEENWQKWQALRTEDCSTMNAVFSKLIKFYEQHKGK